MLQMLLMIWMEETYEGLVFVLNFLKVQEMIDEEVLLMVEDVMVVDTILKLSASIAMDMDIGLVIAQEKETKANVIPVENLDIKCVIAP